MIKEKVRLIIPYLWLLYFPFLVVGFILLSLWARFFSTRSFDVGIGPQPNIANTYYKQALELYGHKVQTFVCGHWFITDKFDLNFGPFNLFDPLKPLRIFWHIVSSYRILYTYFNGTMPYVRSAPWPLIVFLTWLEPLFYKWSGLKVLVMPYGGDIQDLSLCNNLPMKNAIIKDYPMFQKEYRSFIKHSVHSWIMHADHIISGCDWVWYIYHWDTLLPCHFAIDTEKIKPLEKKIYTKESVIKIFHAPNHKNVKGTSHFQKAVNELQQEGYKVELIVLQGKPNHEILEVMRECDIVADQVIIGWYAMTAIEGMTLAKPVLCYLHPDLLNLYQETGLVSDLPLVNCTYSDIKSKIRNLLDNPEEINRIGGESRNYVETNHSLQAIGKLFNTINKNLLEN